MGYSQRGHKGSDATEHACTDLWIDDLFPRKLRLREIKKLPLVKK